MGTASWARVWSLLIEAPYGRRISQLPAATALGANAYSTARVPLPQTVRMAALAAAVYLRHRHVTVDGVGAAAQGYLDILAATRQDWRRVFVHVENERMSVGEPAGLQSSGLGPLQGRLLVVVVHGPPGANGRFFTVRRNEGMIHTSLPFRTAFKNKRIRENSPGMVSRRRAHVPASVPSTSLFVTILSY